MSTSRSERPTWPWKGGLGTEMGLPNNSESNQIETNMEISTFRYCLVVRFLCKPSGAEHSPNYPNPRNLTSTLLKGREGKGKMKKRRKEDQETKTKRAISKGKSSNNDEKQPNHEKREIDHKKRNWHNFYFYRYLDLWEEAFVCPPPSSPPQ